MTVYKDTELINRIISRIPSKWGIYIHIDKKSSIRLDEIDERANKCKKYRINWGSIHHIDAILLLMSKAFMDGYDYYHIITGQDYPATDLLNIDGLFPNKRNSYISMFSIPREGWHGDGTDIIKYRTFSFLGDIRGGITRRLNLLGIIIQKILKLERSLPPYPLYGGPVYCSLSHIAVREIITSRITKDLRERLKYSCVGEEIFFQTILMNSELKENIVKNNLRYMDWTTNPPPKTLTIEDIPNIHKGNYLFIRKVDSKLSKILLDYLDIKQKDNSPS